jgi:hypothetical protein
MHAPAPHIQRAMALAASRWNSNIPARAKLIEVGETHVTYLHPTNGWRAVSKKRLGIA